MADLDNNDIRIGETERIHWVKFDTSIRDLFDVDYIASKYGNFWVFLQIFCVSDCCGLDAFRFYPDDIANASKHVDKALLKEDLSKLKIDLINSSKPVVISSSLNNLVEKSVFTKLLDHLIKNL